jgi:uncharacterized protein (TIGR03067 family)
MRRSLCLLAACGLLIATPSVRADDKPLPAATHELDGTWTQTAAQGPFNDKVAGEMANLKLDIRGHTLHATYGDNKSAEARLRIVPKAEPASVDVTLTQGPEDAKGKTFPAIYRIDDDTLKIAYRDPGKERPKDFAAKAGDVYVVTFVKSTK